MIFFGYHELPFFVASYVFTGRFDPERVAEEYPTAEVTEISYQIKQARANKDSARIEALESARSEELSDAVGSAEEWNRYRAAFRSIVEDAVRQNDLPEGGDLEYVFKRLNQAGSPFLDDHGALWMEVSGVRTTSIVGLSASNILDRDSNSNLARELILARIDRVLKSPMHIRENREEFENDWAAMAASQPGNPTAVASVGGGTKTHDTLISPGE